MIRLPSIDAQAGKHATALKQTALDRLDDEFNKLPPSMQKRSRGPALKKYLQDNIDTMLTGKPAQLRQHIRRIQSRFAWFHDYAQLNPSHNQRNIYDAELAAVVRAVRNAFDYDGFSKTRSGWGAYQLVKAYAMRLCPYCNLNHINFHQDPKVKKKSGKMLEMRPPLDHYYPRATYPYLGISLYNLIPSCHQCNSSIKLQEDPLKAFLPHPLRFPQNAIRFKVDNVLAYDAPVRADDIKILIECGNAAARRHSEFFALPERYGWYTHEIEDMHSKYLSYSRPGNTLASALGRDLVLGFQDKDREQRSLGICLSDIFDHLLKYAPK